MGCFGRGYPLVVFLGNRGIVMLDAYETSFDDRSAWVDDRSVVDL